MTRQLPVELPEGYVEFFKSLENWQNEESLRLKKKFSPDKKDLFRLLNNSRKPLLEQFKPQIDLILFKDSYQRFLSFLKQERKDVESKIDKLINNQNTIDFERVIKPGPVIDLASAAQLSDSLVFPQELFIFTLDHTLRPYLRVMAEPYYEDLGDERFSWQFPNICPICGAKSSFSRLQPEDGQRLMFCDHCFAEWKVQYLACVYCGHDTPGEINYLKVDDDMAYRVYVCEKCKGYLKTYDERSAGTPTDLFIANIETVYLDMLAQDRGYTTHDS
ncbi:MAG: formate dehydrogenase accessory protein FdhE [Syntrophomonadaceae bacterium]